MAKQTTLQTTPLEKKLIPWTMPIKLTTYKPKVKLKSTMPLVLLSQHQKFNIKIIKTDLMKHLQ